MRLLSTSDWHTCHRRTPTKHILMNVEQWFYREVDLKKIDLIVNIGDIFDRYVENCNPDFLEVLEFFKIFFKMCKKYNVKARFVEGTTLHDWFQNKHIILLADEESVDVKYFDKITIETFKEYDDLTVMYVPDNMSNKTPDEIWEIALKELSDNNLKKVDLIFIHAGFYWHLPEKARKHAHMESRWETIVNYGIFNGHIHIPGYNGRMNWSNGSFDRIRHGEEHNKGGWDVFIDKKTKTLEATFYINKSALPYITFYYKDGQSAEELVINIKNDLAKNNYPVSSQFRISGGSKSVIRPIVIGLEKEYPQYGFTDKSDEDAALVDETLYDKSDYQGVTIDKNNIGEYLLDEIKDKLETEGISKKEALTILREIQCDH